MRDSTPLVSVILPTRNRAVRLRRAARSILNQSWTDLELILIDDASIDLTAAVIEEFSASDPRVRGLRLDRRQGAAEARNLGIGSARGCFVAFLDDDDVWLPDKLRLQVTWLRASPGAPGVGSAVLVRDRHGREHQPGLPDRKQLTRDLLVRGNPLATSATVLRRSVLETVGGFDPRLPRLQDWDLWLRISGIAPIGVLPDVLVDYHLSTDAISTDTDSLRVASALMARKYTREIPLPRTQRARLLFALGHSLLLNGVSGAGRRLLWRSVRTRPLPGHLSMALLSSLGSRPYRLVAARHTDRVRRVRSEPASRSPT